MRTDQAKTHVPTGRRGTSLRGMITPQVVETAVLTGLVFLTMAIVPPLLDRVVREPFGLSNRAMTPFLTIHAMAFLLVGLAAGVWSDRLGRRTPFIALGMAGSGAVTVLLPWIGSWPVLLGARALDGLFGAVALAGLMARVVDASDSRTRGVAFGALTMAIPLAYLVGPTLAGLVGSTSPELVFGIAGGLCLAGGVFQSTRLSRPESIRPMAPGLREILRTLRTLPRLWLPFAFGFIDKFTFAAIALLTPLMITDVLAANEVFWGGAAINLFWVGFLLLSLPVGFASRRWGYERVLLGGSLAYGLALAAIGFSNLPGLLVLMALAGGFCALQFVPTTALVGELSGEGQRASAMGAFNAIGAIGMLLGFTVSGILSDGGGAAAYASAYLVAGGMEVVGVLIAASLIGRRLVGRARPTAPAAPAGDTGSLEYSTDAPPTTHHAAAALLPVTPTTRRIPK